MSVEKIQRFLNKTDSPLPFIVASILCCVPVGIAVWLIYSSSANVVDNDYAELMPRIGKMLEPGYDWSHFAHDSSMSSHCLVFMMLFHLFNIACFHWNVPLELYLGLALCLVRVFLIDKMINCPEGAKHRSILNAAFLLLMVGLSFGAANCCVYLYNLTALAYGITFLFLTMGLYSLHRFGTTKKGLLLMALCGFVTAYTNGGAAMFSWVAFGIYILVAPGKNRLAGLATCAFCLVLALGSIWWLVRSGGIQSSTLRPHIPDIRMYLTCFALPFLRDTITPVAYTTAGVVIGALAWIMAAATVLLVLKRRLFTKSVAVSLSFLAFIALNIFAVVAFRTHIAPWYDSFTALFWISIQGLAMSLTGDSQDSQDQKSRPAKSSFVLALNVVPMAGMFILFFCSNLSYRDKDSFRDSHCPSSETAMRNFDTGPTYGEASLFNFTIGAYYRVADLCRPAAKHGLLCFNGPQQILLQGDYLLPRVQAHLPSAQSQLRWISGHSSHKEHDWRESEHLNLAMSGGSAVSWPLKVPSGCSTALFSTKFGLVQNKKNGEAPPKQLLGAISILQKGSAAPLQYQPVRAGHLWNPLAIDLSPFAGREIVIELSCLDQRDRSDSLLVYESPTVKLSAVPQKRRENAAATAMLPANTELSPDFRPPANKDNLLCPMTPELWEFDGLKPKGDEHGLMLYEVTKPLASVTYKPALSIERFTVDRFYISLAVPEKVRPRAVCCQFVVNGSLRQFFIPLLADDKYHTYTYDLKLTNLSPGDEMRAFKVLPLFIADPGPDCVIGIGTIGFLKP